MTSRNNHFVQSTIKEKGIMFSCKTNFEAICSVDVYYTNGHLLIVFSIFLRIFNLLEIYILEETYRYGHNVIMYLI